MNYKLIKLNKFSGDGASIYTVHMFYEEISLFERFVSENINLHKCETKDIISRLIAIGKEVGAEYHYFKFKEGNLGDGVAALYDKPESTLRLYCIVYGKALVIVGGGGLKPKNVRALQEVPKLEKENSLMREISKDIRLRTDSGEIEFSEDGYDMIGHLEFKDTEEYE